MMRQKTEALLEIQNETIPNQIKQNTDKPTLRWIFQLLDGINIVEVKIKEQLHLTIEGLTPLRRKILMFFSNNVQQIYQTSLA